MLTNKIFNASALGDYDSDIADIDRADALNCAALQKF